MRGQPSRAPDVKGSGLEKSKPEGGRLGSEIKLLIPGLSYSILLIIVFIIVRPNYYGFIGIITAGQALIWLITLIRGKDLKGNLFLEMIKIWIIGSVIYFLAKWTGGYGVAGLILFVVAIVAYKLITSRSAYLEAMRSIEKKIWGKPLDRDQWTPGELKRTKIKFVWRKK